MSGVVGKIVIFQVFLCFGFFEVLCININFARTINSCGGISLIGKDEFSQLLGFQVKLNRLRLTDVTVLTRAELGPPRGRILQTLRCLKFGQVRSGLQC